MLDAATGKVFWTQNLLRKFGGSNIQWGLSESPLVLERSHHRDAGRLGRGHRRAEEDRRLADLEDAER